MTTFNDYLNEREYSMETKNHIHLSVKRYRSWLKSNNSSVYLANHRTAVHYIDFLREYYNYKPITINLKLAHLRHYYNYLSTTKNPFSNLRVRGQKKTVRVGCLKEDELLELYINLPQNSHLEQRVKVLASFYIFQGVSTRDVLELEVSHLDLENGKVIIPETRRGNERVLLLNPIQKLHLLEFLAKIDIDASKKLYQHWGAKQSKWVIKHLHFSLQTQKTYFSLSQIRHSVIQNWLKRENLRQVQYMAGHRYITTTEKLLAGDYEGLRLAIVDKHPLG